MNASIDKIKDEIALREKRQLRWSLALLAIPMAIGAAWLGYSFTQVERLNRKRSALKLQLDRSRAETKLAIQQKKRALQEERQALQRAKAAQKSAKVISRKIESLKHTERLVLTAVGQLLKRRDVKVLHPEVNFEALMKSVLDLENPKRKAAVITALLFAWKKVKFKLHSGVLGQGMDSAVFANLFLKETGHGLRRPDLNRRFSTQLMEKYKRTTRPLSGDLMFFSSSEGFRIKGNLTLIYLGPGKQGSKGVYLGLPGAGKGLQIGDAYRFHRATFKGYYRIPYER